MSLGELESHADLWHRANLVTESSFQYLCVDICTYLEGPHTGANRHCSHIIARLRWFVSATAEIADTLLHSSRIVAQMRVHMCAHKHLFFVISIFQLYTYSHMFTLLLRYCRVSGAHPVFPYKVIN